MLDKLEISLDGKSYKADNVIPYNMNHIGRIDGNSDEMYMELKLDVYDDNGNLCVAEYRIPHSQVLMRCNLCAYTDFMAKRYVPLEFFMDSNIYDVI